MVSRLGLAGRCIGEVLKSVSARAVSAGQVLQDMEEDGRFHPALLRLQRGAVSRHPRESVAGAVGFQDVESDFRGTAGRGHDWFE